MLPGHSKIAGHSGTANKNRKAFSKRIALQKVEALNKKVDRKKSDAFLDDISAKRLEYAKTWKLQTKMNWFVRLPVFIATVLILIIITNKIYSRYQAFSEGSITTKSMNRTTNSKKAYLLFVDNGDYSLTHHRYDEAYLSYVKALELDNKGVDARIGLTKTLIEKCKLDNTFCEHKEINLNYLIEEGFIKKGEL